MARGIGWKGIRVIGPTVRAVGTQQETYHAAVMADSPALYYPLGDSATPAVDATGTTSQASIAGATFGASGLGDAATSVDFTGTTSGLLLNTTTALNTLTALTLSGLARSDNWASLNRAIAAVDSGSSPAAVLRVNTSGQVQALVWSATTSLVIVTGTTSLATATTYHLAMTWDGSTIRVYVNGALDNSGSQASIQSVTSGLVAIGRRRTPGAEHYWDGRLAGVAAFRAALSAPRLVAHKTAAGL